MVNLRVDTDDWRRHGAEQDAAAAQDRAMKAPPAELEAFPAECGNVAHALYVALCGFYEWRAEEGEANAVAREGIAAGRRRGADAYDETDSEMSANIRAIDREMQGTRPY
ncbi:type VII secretion target [Nocardia sp. NPDC051832]|uniref:type VII secretion target n=1 Tax=Nocardia sp. NPDC051832 TaxID=3155673 RepID=UPI00343CA71D